MAKKHVPADKPPSTEVLAPPPPPHPPPPAPTPPPSLAPPPPRRATAESMATRQRDISVSEFFTKNRHLLGFDNPAKALLTTVKEAVDNSLDACEEAGILPAIVVEIHEVVSGADASKSASKTASKSTATKATKGQGAKERQDADEGAREKGAAERTPGGSSRFRVIIED